MTITIKSRQKTIDEEFTISTYSGSIDTKSDRHFIRYTETLEEDAGDVRTLIKATAGSVEVTRSGAVNSRLHFIEGETIASSYPTSMGFFDAEIFTKKIRLRTENGFKLQIFYDLTLNGAFVSECEFELFI